jgi:nucleoside-diphosphate-sugar epimerase
MRAVVTGAAGFIGSHLCESLLSRGYKVVGIDSFTDYYDVRHKEANLVPLLEWDRFTLHRDVLQRAPVESLIDGADVVFHLAGQPGVRPSWGAQFATYVEQNVLATQRLLEAAREVHLAKLVFASSSSIYGDAERYPTPETLRPRPISPYGVTKLAAEHLCELYRVAYGVPTVSLRLFTAYGPRQRPDMAFSRLIKAAFDVRPFMLYGDGEQSRDFTFVGDVVDALMAAARSAWTGVANVGGGARTSMNEVVRIVSELAGPVEVVRVPAQRGDARHTAADITVAHEAFGYTPRVRLADGLARMVDAARTARGMPVGSGVRSR